jgi:NarL family two-component system response regulator LiaR
VTATSQQHCTGSRHPGACWPVFSQPAHHASPAQRVGAPIRLLIVDDHAVVRRGLATFLQAFDDLELAGEAANGGEAVRLALTLQPDVVLMDLVMPEMDGATATREILERCPTTRVVVLTSFAEQDLVPRAMDAGATSYLLKNVSVDELVGAVRAAAAGRATLAAEALHILIGRSRSKPPAGNQLSAREGEVLRLMVEGLKNSDIASRLIIGHSTVKFHVSSILGKLGVETRTEAVALALQNRMLVEPC